MLTSQTTILSNGLRMIHLHSESPVAYCGFAVNAGTRDEQSDEFGLAHFIEHMLFKGTPQRRSWHILNRLEQVGGELNAYTTKEETFIYATFLSGDFERAVELLSDLVFHSNFPEKEIEKERAVVLDEINSYKDNPAELIYDEFENMLFRGHEIGHHILGETQSLNRFTQQSCLSFFNRNYLPGNMVFFSMGKIPFAKIVHWVTKYAGAPIAGNTAIHRTAPGCILPDNRQLEMESFQAHVMIGARGYSLFDEKRPALHFLNNILGGPGMNSRLNLSLREKHGYVYNVESNLTTCTDTGVFSVYFGCDQKYVEKCIALVHKELKELRNKALTDSQLYAAKKQLKGQLGISGENSENVVLSMGKVFLHKNRYYSLEDNYNLIDKITSRELWEVANEIFDDKQLSQLIIL